nr:unnamed protein product [Naegleria fowleri]
MPKKPAKSSHHHSTTTLTCSNNARDLWSQEAKSIRLDYGSCDWSDRLNQILEQMVTRMNENGYILQQTEEMEFNVWKHSLHGKPHQRKIRFQSIPWVEERILEIIDGQKQIDIKTIREVDLPKENELTFLQASHQTPLSFSFDNINSFLSFGIIFLYGLLKCHDRLQMSENLSCLLVSSLNDSTHSYSLSSDMKMLAFAGIPYSFTVLSKDVLDVKIATLEPIWKATLIAHTLNQQNVKQIRRNQVCDICSYVDSKTIFAFTTNISGEYILELECQRNKKWKKIIPVSVKSSKFSFKHSYICFQDEEIAKANEQKVIDLHICDMFNNPSFSGFNLEMLEIQIFEVVSKSRYIWANGQFIDGEASLLNIVIMQSETKISVAFSSKKSSTYEIEMFYTVNDRRLSFNSPNQTDSRLVCKVVPSTFDHYTICCSEDDSTLYTSMETISMVFTAVDEYENELELDDLNANIEIKLRYESPAEYLEYADFLQPNHSSIKATYFHEKGPKLKTSFTPLWKGVYSVHFYFKGTKIRKTIFIVNESACEQTRLEQLRYDIQRITIQKEKDRIQEEINAWTKNQTFRQILNHVVEKYHPNKEDHASLLLPISADRPEILKLYKKVVFIIHTDQSPLLRNYMNAQERELLICELNLIFNAVQQAYRRWKALTKLH